MGMLTMKQSLIVADCMHVSVYWFQWLRHNIIWSIAKVYIRWPQGAVLITVTWQLGDFWVTGVAFLTVHVLKTTLADHNWDRCMSQLQSRHFDPNPGFLISDNDYKYSAGWLIPWCVLYPLCNWRRPFWGRNILLSEAVYIPRVLR